MSEIIDTRTDVTEVGDEVEPIDAWLLGDLDFADLSPQDQDAARKLVASIPDTDA